MSWNEKADMKKPTPQSAQEYAQSALIGVGVVVLFVIIMNLITK